jgi:hypothetical protein
MQISCNEIIFEVSNRSSIHTKSKICHIIPLGFKSVYFVAKERTENMRYNKIYIYLDLAIGLFLIAPHHTLIADEENHSIELSSDPEMKSLHTQSQVCAYLEKRVVGYVDLVYYVKNCKLRLVQDTALINSLIQTQKKPLVALDEAHYSALAMGKNYTTSDYAHEFGSGKPFVDLCNHYEQNVVTADNIHFYYIQSCKKRKFDGDYDGVSSFDTKEFKPILAIPFTELDLFKSGQPIALKKQELKVTKFKSNLEIRADLPKAQILCSQLKSRIVSFYSSIFLVENCTLRFIMDATLEIQQKAADSKGGIQELTTQQRLGIPEGKSIHSADALKKL